MTHLCCLPLVYGERRDVPFVAVLYQEECLDVELIAKYQPNWSGSIPDLALFAVSPVD